VRATPTKFKVAPPPPRPADPSVAFPPDKKDDSGSSSSSSDDDSDKKEPVDKILNQGGIPSPPEVLPMGVPILQDIAGRDAAASGVNPGSVRPIPNPSAPHVAAPPTPDPVPAAQPSTPTQTTGPPAPVTPSAAPNYPVGGTQYAFLDARLGCTDDAEEPTTFTRNGNSREAGHSLGRDWAGSASSQAQSRIDIEQQWKYLYLVGGSNLKDQLTGEGSLHRVWQS